MRSFAIEGSNPPIPALYATLTEGQVPFRTVWQERNLTIVGKLYPHHDDSNDDLMMKIMIMYVMMIMMMIILMIMMMIMMMITVIPIMIMIKMIIYVTMMRIMSILMMKSSTDHSQYW